MSDEHRAPMSESGEHFKSKHPFWVPKVRQVNERPTISLNELCNYFLTRGYRFSFDE